MIQRRDGIERRLSSFALILASLGLILLYSFLGKQHSAYVARTFRLANLGLICRLLLILPGALLAWAVRRASLRELRFSLASFLTYALLPLLLALHPALLSGLRVWGGVRIMVSSWEETLRSLQSIWALVAGWGLGFSFEEEERL
jgi:hypothetical protein